MRCILGLLVTTGESDAGERGREQVVMGRNVPSDGTSPRTIGRTSDEAASVGKILRQRGLSASPRVRLSLDVKRRPRYCAIHSSFAPDT